MSARCRPGAVLALSVALATGVAVPATAQPTAAAPSPVASAVAASPTASPSASPGDAPGDEREPLSPEEVKAQVEQAAKLQRELAAADKQIAAMTADLAKLAAASSKAMDAVSTARTAQRQARDAETRQVHRLNQLNKELAAARQDVSNMAYDAYVNGSIALRDLAAVVELTRGDQGGNDAALAEYLAANRAAEARQYEVLAAAQKQAAAAATKARTDREAATAKAEAAHKEAAAALGAQQKKLAQLQKVAGSRRAELTTIGVDAAGISGVDLSALEKLANAPLCTEDRGDYPNGMFPPSALCGVAGYSGHTLRPAAARAIEALAAAYEKDLGSKFCMTDTYRTYASQVDVKARKPHLAATPGTSNHGLGLAVDLCGGIESFGTPQHRWMQQHAPLFGFYHPAWARADGSKPEPWHWEFAQ